MSDPLSPSRFEEWARAQAEAIAAERRVAQIAADHAAGRGPAPSMADIQNALILRDKASVLLTAVVSQTAAGPARQGGGAVSGGDTLPSAGHPLQH